MTIAASEEGQERPKAEGFPLAPLIEAILDIQFEAALDESEIETAKDALSEFYPRFTHTPQHRVKFNQEAETISVEPAEKHYRGEGSDPTEVILLRPEGFGTSQLAPYKDWEALYTRFRRDLDAVSSALSWRPLRRMAVRSINRIDIAPEGDVVRYENFLAVRPFLPEKLDPILSFQLSLVVDVPEIDARATIRVNRCPPAVDGKASFNVDVDLFRVETLPQDGLQLAELFQRFRDHKNDLYRNCLTPKALEEFE